MPSKSSNFDPYHKWLGIPPQEQPADYYRLLGLVKFEDDPDVIAIAADQRMGFVQKMAIGQHLEHSQKLLNELARARLVLVDTQKKEVYDASLIQVPDQSSNSSRRRVNKTESSKESGKQQRLKTKKPIVESPAVSSSNIQHRLMQWGRSRSGIAILLLLCLFTTSWLVRGAVLNFEDDNSGEMNESALVSNDTGEQRSDTPEISTQSPQVQREKFPPDLKTNNDDRPSPQIADSLVSAKEMQAKRKQPSISPTTTTVAPTLETPIKNPWLDFAFLEKKLQDEGVDQLLTEIPQDSENPDVETVRHALRLSANALRRDKKQLWAQLHARTLQDRTTVIDQLLGNKPPTTSLVSRFPTMSQSGGPLRHFLRGSSSVRSEAITPDGKIIVSVHRDNIIIVWDAESGQVRKTLEGHSSDVRSVAITSDGRTIVSGSDDGSVKVWDVETGQVRQTLEGNSSGVRFVATTPDGKIIVSVHLDNIIKVWDAELGQSLQILRGQSSPFLKVAITPDGGTIVSGSHDNMIRVWDTNSGQIRQALQGNSPYLHSVAITPDGQTVVIGGSDSTIQLLDSDSGEITQTLKGHTSYVWTAVITPDGRTIISGSDDGTIKVWDVESGQIRKTLEGHSSKVRSVAITSDGRTIFSGSDDGSVKVWDAEIGLVRQTHNRHSSIVSSVAITPDEQIIVSGSKDGTIKVWDADSGQILQTLQGTSTHSVVITPDGQTIASGSGTIKVWDVETGQNRQTLEGHSRYVSSVAITPDGKTIVSGGSDKTIKVWDVESGQNRQTLDGNSGYVSSVAITPDGRTIVSGSSDKTIKVWDAETGQVHQTLKGHSSGVNSVAITPDGRTIISGSYDDTVKVWDAESGRDRQTLKGHSSGVNSVAITPDGKTVVSGSSDGTIKVWELVSGNLMAEYKCDSSISSVAIAGSTIIANGHAGDVHVFDFIQPEEAHQVVESTIPLQRMTSKESKSIHEKMQVEIDFILGNVPLDFALSMITKEVSVEIEIDREDLVAAGALNSPVQNLQLTNATALSAIHQLIKEYEDLCVVLDDSANLVRVTSISNANSNGWTPHVFKPSLLSGEAANQILVKMNSDSSTEKLESLFNDLESEVVPASALQRIEAFTTFYNLNDNQKQNIEQEKQVWQNRDSEDLIRVDDNFIPLSKFNEDKQTLIQYLNSVNQSCQAGQSIDQILSIFDRATIENSDSIIAYYHSGLIHANWYNDNIAAIADFRRVLSVIPDHSGTLNNMAICEMKSGNYSKALGSWRKAMEGSQNLINRSRIVHNVAYAHAISKTNSLKMPSSFSRFSERLLSDMATEDNSGSFTGTAYWKFSPWIANPLQFVDIHEYPELNAIPSHSLRVVQRATAIAIGEGYVLTSSESLKLPYLEDSVQLKVQIGNENTKTDKGAARVIAFNREMGLTLLHCPELSIPYLKFKSVTSLSEEPVQIGFRSGSDAISFHSTNKELTQNDSNYSLYLDSIDQISPPDGAAVFDNSGNFMGIVSRETVSNAESELIYAYNANAIKKFLIAAGVNTNNVTDVSIGQNSWDLIKNRLINHIVQIELCYPEESMSLERVATSKYNSSHYLNNHSCYMCDGLSTVSCDNKECANGRTSQKVRVVVGRTQMGAPIYGTNIVTSRCTRCNGRANLDCPKCSDGTNSRF